jgi:hypothetical protein
VALLLLPYPLMLTLQYYRPESPALDVLRVAMVVGEDMLLTTFILRSARIIIAHKASRAARQTLLFRLFSREYRPLLLLLAVFLARLGYSVALRDILYSPVDLDPYHPSLAIQQVQRVVFLGLASYAVFLQRTVRRDFAIYWELIPLLLLAQASIVVQAVCYQLNVNVSCVDGKYPALYMVKIVECGAVLALSFVMPLRVSR